jgi:hypothetical protein
MQVPTKLPPTISAALDGFFDSPVKRDRNGELHDIRRSSLHRDEAVALAILVLELQPQNSLEIGLAEAGSCVAITAARTYCDIEKPHVALDPFQESLSGAAGLLELERLGLRQRVNWQAEYSESYLLDQFRGGNANVDFAFVDGGHSIGQKVTDAFLLNKVMRPGGVVTFHDGLLLSTSMAVRYLVKECGYTVIPLAADGHVVRLLRQSRYLFRFGHWYVRTIVSRTCRSLVATRKPALPSK